MAEIDRVFAAASAVCQEATRRAFGDLPDSRFDVPLAMLLDLHETLEGHVTAENMAATPNPRNGSDGRDGAPAAPEEANRRERTPMDDYIEGVG